MEHLTDESFQLLTVDLVQLVKHFMSELQFFRLATEGNERTEKKTAIQSFVNIRSECGSHSCAFLSAAEGHENTWISVVVVVCVPILDLFSRTQYNVYVFSRFCFNFADPGKYVY